MQTSNVRCNGVRDSTEEAVLNNYAAEFAKRLVDKEEAERKAADEALEKRISTHATETATDKKSSHVFLSDAVNSTLNAASGKTAATPYAVKQVNDGLITERNERKAQFSDLDKRLKQEITDRKNGDNNLKDYTDSAIGSVNDRFSREIGELSDENIKLNRLITEETTNRENADAALDERLSAVEQKAHTHENKGILDGITEERVLKWDEGSEGQITLGEYLEHLAEAERQFGMLWGLLGMTVYDGGWFGMEQIDIPLDGGLFEDTVFTPLDCGGFEPYVIPSGGVGTVVDGGNY